MRKLWKVMKFLPVVPLIVVLSPVFLYIHLVYKCSEGMFRAGLEILEGTARYGREQMNQKTRAISSRSLSTS